MPFFSLDCLVCDSQYSQYLIHGIEKSTKLNLNLVVTGMHLSSEFGLSINEIKIGIESIKKFNKPYLVGVHISEGTKLPSGEKISDLINNLDTSKLLGVTLSCVSPENFQINLNEIKNLGMPFGFKLNGFVTTAIVKIPFSLAFSLASI